MTGAYDDIIGKSPKPKGRSGRISGKKPMSNSKRKYHRMGKFEISDSILHNVKLHGDLKFIFSHMVVINAEPSGTSVSIEYTAYSDLFDEIPLGQKVPHYLVGLNTGKDGKIRIRVYRK